MSRDKIEIEECVDLIRHANTPPDAGVIAKVDWLSANAHLQILKAFAERVQCAAGTKVRVRSGSVWLAQEYQFIIQNADIDTDAKQRPFVTVHFTNGESARLMMYPVVIFSGKTDCALPEKDFWQTVFACQLKSEFEPKKERRHRPQVRVDKQRHYQRHRRVHEEEKDAEDIDE
jgi:hypothetical protein